MFRSRFVYLSIYILNILTVKHANISALGGTETLALFISLSSVNQVFSSCHLLRIQTERYSSFSSLPIPCLAFLLLACPPPLMKIIFVYAMLSSTLGPACHYYFFPSLHVFILCLASTLEASSAASAHKTSIIARTFRAREKSSSGQSVDISRDWSKHHKHNLLHTRQVSFPS
jgi:hypothetical protein